MSLMTTTHTPRPRTLRPATRKSAYLLGAILALGVAAPALAGGGPPHCGPLEVAPDGNSATVTAYAEAASGGLQEITNFTTTNGTYTIPPIEPGATEVVITSFKTDTSKLTTFSFDVADANSQTVHCT